MNRLVILLLIFSPIFIHAQKRLFLKHDMAFAFYDYQEKKFCVLDDSTFIWKYDATKIKWQKVPLELSIDMPFAKFLSEFIPMSDKGTPVYFVHSGCGVVYALNENKIFRHDHSFYHMNQFEGAFFMDEGEPRIYGGYGLFTSKNIITRYDTIEREWFVLNNKGTPPPAGTRNIIQKNKRYYYVFDGVSLKNSNFEKINDLYRFDVKSNKWTNLGSITKNVLGKKIEFNFEHYQNHENLISCCENMIITYDLNKFRYKKYKFNSSSLYRSIIKADSLYLINKVTSKPSRYIEISNDDFLKQFEIEEGDLLRKKPSFMKRFIWLLGFFLIILSVLFLIFLIKNKKRKTNLISNNEQSVVSLFDEFNSTEKDLIKLLIKSQETGLEISYINDLVNHDQPSIDTLKKRRETLLKELRYKLALKFNIPQDEVFIEQRMTEDKRMKLLYINEIIRLEFKLNKTKFRR
jgi:preprotein translocase subunit SecG